MVFDRLKVTRQGGDVSHDFGAYSENLDGQEIWRGQDISASLSVTVIRRY